MTREDPLRFAVVGLDHRHVYDLIGGLVAAGAVCAGYDPASTDSRVVEGVRERFPDLPVSDRARLLDDGTIGLVVCAAVPSERAGIAVAAMRAGKDVLLDKPGVVDEAGLASLRAAVAETGHIVSICFSERLTVRSAEVATRLVTEGAIGRVIQTVGLGPHRLNKAIRPDWFFDPTRAGGILADIASHQIDQFLVFTGSSDAEIAASGIGHYGTQTGPAFQDFGELLLRSDRATGFVRVDWFTPDGLPAWGDGRLVILGTEGTIELRKYLDIEGRPGADHLFLSDGRGTRYVACADEPIRYFRRLVADVRDRTETAMSQEHVFTVCRLALAAQAAAVPLGDRRIPA